LAADTASKS